MTHPRMPCGQDGRADAGFVLVFVLWLLAALAGFAVVASVYVTQSARTLAVLNAGLETDMLTTAAVELAAYQLSTAGTVRRPSRGTFEFRLSGAQVVVEYLSEAARINLNMAPRAMLAGLFAALGSDADSASTFADRIAGWRRAPGPNGQDGEDGLYGAAGRLARRAPFTSTEELWLVLGLPADTVDRVLPYVTVYSGIAEVNVLDASPIVLAALPEMTPMKLDAFLNARDTLPPDAESVLNALGGRQPGATTRGSDAYRLRIHLTLSSGRRRTSEVVIMIAGPGEREAYRVLSWHDDLAVPRRQLLGGMR
ncbi:Putative general secretion pathway protein K [Bradyrhizobium sp. ORS 278]|uniref:general secretion pathway protein GspK n=1 Tax=Bradyrhizobium sp. (strain ORS 278) TaxID=114615 RepID=UPI0001507C26|nr:type II secretion system protein GspK [Bradyrhizobium sp. ORS 278]CAL76041.1 Putative general secretion pathway protein K [Bradyrhizobium sp. ORS 278]